ncbi:MAG: YIP1 family protein [Caldilineaceae bacterium]|nr:YIP1 family protein [Caldilineaceae bacterium]
MLQPRTYPELLGKALMLDADPHVVLQDDDQPWVEGLVITVLVGALAGLAQLIGGWLLNLTMPPAALTLSALLDSIGATLGPAVQAESEPAVRLLWGWVGLITGYGGGWGRLLIVAGMPLLLVVQWAFFGFIGYGVASYLGGKGSLSQTLGAVGLMVAPQVLLFFRIIPFVSVSGLLLAVWSLLIAYRAIEVVHELPWRKAVISTLTLPVILGLAGLAAYLVNAAILYVGGM